MMRIIQLDTLRMEAYPNLLYVQVHSDGGATGIGETFFGAATAEAYLHETVASALLGKEIDEIEGFTDGLEGYLGFASSSAETRGNSAVDIALWDLTARLHDIPLHRLLNDQSRSDIPVYNTCAGPDYVQKRPEVASTNWGIRPAEDKRYEDLNGFLHHADELAYSLIEQGIGGMKIWPFDQAAEASGGQYISPADLRSGLGPIEKIRLAVGAHIDIMIEMHGLWNVPMAQRIASAIEEFKPRWIEDPVKLHDFGALGRVARSTRTPIAAGETLGGPSTHERMMQHGSVGVVIVDAGWAGGITAARRVSVAADEQGLEVAFHDCTGPVGLAVATHLALAAPNAAVQEIVRAFYAGWYPSLVTTLPLIQHGRIRAPDAPGLGVELHPDLLTASGTHVRSSRWTP